MEIKVGDKVRVSKDAPRMYISIFTYICEEASCTVEAVKGGIATIKANDKIIAIPTKYLTKVDAEAKEPKFKVGDVVRISDLYKAYGYLEFDEDTTTLWRGRLWHMKEIETEFRVEYLHELENLFYMFYEKELIPD